MRRNYRRKRKSSRHHEQEQHWLRANKNTKDSDSSTPEHPILRLQGMIGNQGVQRLLDSNQANSLPMLQRWRDGVVPNQADNVENDNNQLDPETARGIDHGLRNLYTKVYEQLILSDNLTKSFGMGSHEDLANLFLEDLYPYQGQFPALDGLINSVENFCEAYYSVLHLDIPIDEYKTAKKAHYRAQQELMLIETHGKAHLRGKLNNKKLPKFLKNRKRKQYAKQYGKAMAEEKDAIRDLGAQRGGKEEEIKSIINEHQGFQASWDTIQNDYRDIHAQLAAILANHEEIAMEAGSSFLSEGMYENALNNIVQFMELGGNLDD